jgi:PAS domain S-box-containing protein
VKAEEPKESAENPLVGNGEINALLRAGTDPLCGSHDWSQTPLGAIETWPESLKTAAQILLTELNQAQVQQATPREWTEREVKWVEETAEQTWATVERARAEAALRESEAKYRTLFESVDEGFCTIEVLFDADGKPFDHRILQANPAFKRQSGIANPVGKRSSELAPGLEQDWNDLYAKVIQTGESIRTEERSDTLDRWFEVLVSRVGDAAMHQVAIVFTDISDRKKTEETLRESEQRFRLMADAVPQIVWITDAQGRVEFFNKQWSHYTGVPYEPTTAAEVAANFVHPEDGDRTMAAFNAAKRSGGIFAVEHRIRSATGSYRWFLVRAEPYRDLQTGEIVRWFGASVDIHDRKQAEATITTDLENTRLLRDLSTQLLIEDNIQVLYDKIMATAITLTRADAGTVQILDRATQELMLLASQGFDRTITDHFDRVNAGSNTSCGLALLRGTRAFIDFDMPECDDPCGALRMHVNAGYRSAQSTPLLSRSGRPIGMVSTHWRKHHRPTERELRFLDLLARQAADLLEQRQTEAERQQVLEREQAAREEAERANRLKDEFLAVLSHELRSPLNPILGWTRLLRNGKLNPARQMDALATIERNAKLQAQLIEDLLDISRIMQGKLTLSATPVSLAFVITAAIETVRLAADAKQIQIMLDLDPNVAPVSGDAARLQQVVWNLLSNAVKFTEHGGQVTVQLRRVVACGSLGHRIAQIRVIDTGRGISPQFLPYVFEYFRQEDGSTTRQFGGLGLGLAIVRQIVELHGGTVKAESSGEHQGATFIVQLPTLQASLVDLEPTQVQAHLEMRLQNVQILLVDDDTDTREFEAFLLEQQEATVIATASGREALQALDRSLPDVIISDIGMAEIDGYLLMQQIRLRPPTQGGTIPAIALTAYAAEIDQKKALQAGYQKHLTKPLEPEQLVSAIVTLLNSD